MSDLIDPQGHRLYLTAAERSAFLAAAAKAPREVRSFCEVLHFTGCRISEALALTVKRVDLDGQSLGCGFQVLTVFRIVWNGPALERRRAVGGGVAALLVLNKQIGRGRQVAGRIASVRNFPSMKVKELVESPVDPMLTPISSLSKRQAGFSAPPRGASLGNCSNAAGVTSSWST